jgi:hypothetical protein
LPGQEKSVRFLKLFGLSAGFWLALHHFDLNLTSLSIMFNNFPRGDEAKSVLKRLFGQRSRKRKSYKKPGQEVPKDSPDENGKLLAKRKNF